MNTILCCVPFSGHVTAVPSATSSQGAGPGVGIRLNSSWQPPKTTPIRLSQPSLPDREVAKLEKFRSVLAGPNTDLGNIHTERLVDPFTVKKYKMSPMSHFIYSKVIFRLQSFLCYLPTRRNEQNI